MPTEQDKQQAVEAAQQQAPAPGATSGVESEAGEQENGASSSDDALKSEISLVFEIALKRQFTVTFEVLIFNCM